VTENNSSQEEVSRLLFELREQRQVARSTLFWGFGLALASFAGLMVFFILYLNAARTNIETSIAEGLPGFGHEVAELIRTELAEGKELQKEVVSLGNQSALLSEKLAAAEVEIAILKKKERENKRLLDLRRAELETQKKMYEELVALTEANQSVAQTADRSLDGNGDTQVGDDSPGGAKATPLREASQIIAEINQLLDNAGEQKARIVEFQTLSQRGLENPAISVRGFRGKQTAVLNPGFLRLYTEGDAVRIQSGGAGSYTPLGEPAQLLDEGALDVIVSRDMADGIRHSGLRRLVGLEPVSKSHPDQNGSGRQHLLSTINDLLSRERGRQFRFRAIGSVDESELKNVCFDDYDKKGDLKRSVEATGCRIKLFTKDRYVEVQFEDGFIVQDKKRIPFYNNQYRLTLANVDPKVWKQAGLDFIVEE